MDNEGDERTHLHAVDTVTGVSRDLTPDPVIRARFLGVTASRPHHVLVAMNRQRADLSPTRTSWTCAPARPNWSAENHGFAGWHHDHDLRVSGAFRWHADGGLTLLVRDGTDWRRCTAQAPTTPTPPGSSASPRTAPV